MIRCGDCGKQLADGFELTWHQRDECPKTQPTLPLGDHDPVDLAEGERRRDEGTARVTENADQDWRDAFEAAGVRLISNGRTRITAEDIIGIVGLPPGHRNAIGAAMRGFAVRHNLRNVGTVKAARVARHAGRVTVWERM